MTLRGATRRAQNPLRSIRLPTKMPTPASHRTTAMDRRSRPAASASDSQGSLGVAARGLLLRACPAAHAADRAVEAPEKLSGAHLPSDGNSADMAYGEVNLPKAPT